MSFILPGGLGQNMAPHIYTGFSTVKQTTTTVLPGWFTGGVAPTFSNNNRTVIAPSGGEAYVSGTSFQTSGKRYFETTVADALTDQGKCQTGVGNTNATLKAGGFDANSSGSYASGGTYLVYFNNAIAYTTTLAVANGDVIGVAVDFTASGLVGVYFRFNANWGNRGTPSTTFPSAPDVQITITAGTGAIIICSVGSNGTTTLNTGYAPFSHAIPTGYTAWG